MLHCSDHWSFPLDLGVLNGGLLLLNWHPARSRMALDSLIAGLEGRYSHVSHVIWCFLAILGHM